MAKKKKSVLEHPGMKPLFDKERFVKVLAQFLVGDQAKKSILLEMSAASPTFQQSSAGSLVKEWAALRAETPLFGYPTLEEAEKLLTKWLC